MVMLLKARLWKPSPGWKCPKRGLVWENLASGTDEDEDNGLQTENKVNEDQSKEF